MKSLKGKTWLLRHDRAAKESLWSALLAAREILDPGTFFSGAESGDLHDPFLFPDMEKAVARINSALQKKERIVLYGDYDVDGTSGASLLVQTLRLLGAEVSYRVPHRMKDGYGLHNHIIQELSEKNVSVLISVDCGISCASEVDFAKDCGIDVIITDHHHIPEKLPKAYAILHPLLALDYPFKYLSGSGVAFKFASALLISAGKEDFIMQLTDLASLGTVADCVPLIGENRALVKIGLKQMKNTSWPGLQAILENAGAWEDENFTAETIGFKVGPRINASGRIDNPLWSMQTLLAQSDSDARVKSAQLEKMNAERRKIGADILEEVLPILNDEDDIHILSGENWSSGIVGLIAGRIQEKTSKPAIVLENRGEAMVGSFRSASGLHAVKALDCVRELLENYGGHEQAAGMHLKSANYANFKKELLLYARDFFKQNPHDDKLHLDTALKLEDLNVDVFTMLSRFEPFGIANPKPVFLMEDVEIISCEKIGKAKDHVKVKFDFHGKTFEMMAFYAVEYMESLANMTSFAVHFECNFWKGKAQVRFIFVDAR